MLRPGTLVKARYYLLVYDEIDVSRSLYTVKVDELMTVLRLSATQDKNLIAEIITTSGVKGWIFTSNVSEV